METLTKTTKSSSFKPSIYLYLFPKYLKYWSEIQFISVETTYFMGPIGQKVLITTQLNQYYSFVLSKQSKRSKLLSSHNT